MNGDGRDGKSWSRRRFLAVGGAALVVSGRLWRRHHERARVADVGAEGAPTLCLTFDTGGGRGGNEVDLGLIELLERERLVATFFLNARWINENRAVADRLFADELFEIANHGTRHVPLSVTGRAAYGIAGTDFPEAAADEVWADHTKLTALMGTPPKWFRSGTAHYDDVGAAITVDLGERPVGFAVNGDQGATASATQVNTALTGTRAGDIVIGHMNHPGKATAAGLAAALPTLRARGTRFVTVSGGGGATT